MHRLALLLMMLALSACEDHHHRYNGYIDADLTYLSSNFAGQLTDLLVHRGDAVKSQQLLFKLEQTTEAYSVERAQFSESNLITQRQAILDQIRYEEINYHRNQTMIKQHAASQNDVDMSKKNLDVLHSQLDGIDYQIQSSHLDTADKKWQMLRKESRSNANGIVFDTYFTQQEYVQAGQPVLSLITKDNIKVIFYVPEKELNNIALNTKVTFSTDNNPHLAKGRIRYISNIAQYTPPIIYSREERQNLIFRVEAGIDSPDLNILHLGQPVSLEIHR